MASKSLPNKILKDAVNELTSLLKNTKAFVLKEAPTVLREILVYNRFVYSLQLILGVLLIIAGFIFLHNSNAIPDIYSTYYNEYKSPDLKIALLVFAYLSWFCGLITSIVTIPSLLKVFLAPKVFLIEYIREIMM